MKLEKFRKFIKANMTLFNTYFKAFHENLWGVTNGLFNFLDNVEKEGTAFILHGKIYQPSHLMLSGNSLFFAVSTSRREDIFRVIFLEGVLIRRIEGNSISIKDVSHELSLAEIEFES